MAADLLLLSVYRLCLADHGNTQAACTETAERCGVDRAAVWAAMYRERREA